MQTDSSAAIEFRCTSCWQANYAPLESEGQETTCAHCHQAVAVPEATPERIKSLEECSPVAPTHSVADAFEVNELAQASEAEQMRWVEGRPLPLEERDFSGYDNASLIARLGASILDSIFIGLSFGASILLVAAAQSLGVISFPEPGIDSRPDIGILAIVSFAPFLALCLQWNLIATRGQSVGKFLCCIRIVTLNGQLPGFVNGVVIRNWVRVLLGFIPFFGLLDILFIFGESQRCIHDLMAGTRVVNA